MFLLVQKLIKLRNNKVNDLILAVILSALLEFFRLGSPFIIKIIIDELSNINSVNIQYILLLVGSIFVIDFFISIYRYFTSRLSNYIFFDFQRILSHKLHNKMLSLPLAYHEKENTGNKISKIERGIYKISDVLDIIMYRIVPVVLQAVIAVITLLFIHPYLSLGLLAFMAFFVYVSFLFNKKAKPLREKENDLYEKSSGSLTESLINIFSVQSFASEPFESRKYKKQGDN